MMELEKGILESGETESWNDGIMELWSDAIRKTEIL